MARKVAPTARVWRARARARRGGGDRRGRGGGTIRAASFRPAKLGPPRPGLRTAGRAAAVFGDVARPAASRAKGGRERAAAGARGLRGDRVDARAPPLAARAPRPRARDPKSPVPANARFRRLSVHRTREGARDAAGSVRRDGADGGGSAGAATRPHRAPHRPRAPRRAVVRMSDKSSWQIHVLPEKSA